MASEVHLDVDELRKAIGAVVDDRKLSRTFGSVARYAVGWSVADLAKNRLRGQDLNRITGRAIRSVTQSPRFHVRRELVEGIYGSNEIYVAAHNDGFAGVVAIPAHERVLRSGKTVQVRAHSRTMNMRARRFFEKTRDASVERVRRASTVGLFHLAKTGRVPTVQEVSR